MRKTVLAGIVAMPAIAATGADPGEMLPGYWETRMSIVSLKVPEVGRALQDEIFQSMSKEPRIETKCMTAEDLDEPGENFLDKECEFDRFVFADGRVDIEADCDMDGLYGALRFVGTYEPEQYAVSGIFTAEDDEFGPMHMRMSITGRRISDSCPIEPEAAE